MNDGYFTSPTDQIQALTDGIAELRSMVKKVAATLEDRASNTGRDNADLHFDDACVEGGFGRTKGYQFIADGRLDAYRLGRRTFITRESLDALKAKLREEGREKFHAECEARAIARQKRVTASHKSGKQQEVAHGTVVDTMPDRNRDRPVAEQRHSDDSRRG